MKQHDDHGKQLEDIVDIENHALPISVIELIANNEEASKYYAVPISFFEEAWRLGESLPITLLFRF